MEILTDQPWLALIPAGVFLACASMTRRKTIVGGAAAAWLLYGAYELAMKYRISMLRRVQRACRLLVLYPLLLGISIVGLVAAAFSVLKRNHS